MGAQGEVTALLKGMRAGDAAAKEQLAALVYPDLRRMAARYLRSERPGHTLQATALVNEGFVKLLGGQPVDWKDRAHFFAVAATQLRRILVDHARGVRADKRGGGAVKVSLTKACGVPAEREEDVMAIDQALERLSAIDPRAAKIVELRFFGGLDEQEAAEVVGISVATLKRDWRFAKAWLFSQLKTLDPAAPQA
jgi:RNA polymerase sigma factor (TIGR02999 family)